MQTRFITTQRAVIGAIGAAALLIAGAAHGALQDRDLNNDSVVDAFYDTDLDITWLRDANTYGVASYWTTAVLWADLYSFAGYDDWRLPTSDACEGFDCTGSEMGHLWYVELGNVAGGPMTNTGNSQNLQSGVYWSATENVPGSQNAYYFQTTNGFQCWGPAYISAYAMVVRDGDVAVVPEPGVYALMLAGLAALAFARRQLRR